MVGDVELQRFRAKYGLDTSSGSMYHRLRGLGWSDVDAQNEVYRSRGIIKEGRIPLGGEGDLSMWLRASQVGENSTRVYAKTVSDELEDQNYHTENLLLKQALMRWDYPDMRKEYLARFHIVADDALHGERHSQDEIRFDIREIERLPESKRKFRRTGSGLEEASKRMSGSSAHRPVDVRAHTRRTRK